MWWVTYFLVFFCSIGFGKAQFDAFVVSNSNTHTDEETVRKKFSTLESRIKTISNEAMKIGYPIAMEIMGSLNISRSCFRDCGKLLLGMRKLNTWAIKFLDATTKSADGLLNIHAPSLGSYDECVDNKVLYQRPEKMKGQVMFQGKYCNVRVKLYLTKDDNATLIDSKGIPNNGHTDDSIFSEIRSLAPMLYFAAHKAGVCLPSGCSTDDANEILRLVSDYFGVSLKATRCMIKEEKKYTPVMIAIMTVYSFAGLLVLLGTILDIYSRYFQKKYSGTGIRILEAFSFIASFKKLTNTSCSSKTSCLHGMRFLSMSWVILGHTYMFNILINHSFPRNYDEYKSDLAFQAVINGTFSVDTFFFVSGFLLCYITTKLVIIKKNPFSLKLYIIHRLWRIIPAYVFVIGYEFLKPLTGSGPLFHEVLLFDEGACEKNWWTNLLFINNLYNRENMCIPQSWFIAVDTQLYILALGILLPLFRWPKVGICIAGVAIAVGIGVTGFMSHAHKVVGVFIAAQSVEDLGTWHRYHNMSLHLHVPPFCVGLLLGYLLATRSDFKTPKVLQVLGWIVSVALCLTVVYGSQKWNSGNRPTPLDIITYSAFCRIAWSLGIAWMTFCCVTGHGGVINYILSWKVWKPLGQLTYFAYLVHVTVIVSFMGNMRTILHLDHYLVVWIFLGHLGVTYSVAFVGYVLVESPFQSMKEIIFLNTNGKGSSTFPQESVQVEKDLEKNEQVKDKNRNDVKMKHKSEETILVINKFERHTPTSDTKCTHL